MPTSLWNTLVSYQVLRLENVSLRYNRVFDWEITIMSLTCHSRILLDIVVTRQKLYYMKIFKNIAIFWDSCQSITNIIFCITRDFSILLILLFFYGRYDSCKEINNQYQVTRYYKKYKKLKSITKIKNIWWNNTFER